MPASKFRLTIVNSSSGNANNTSQWNTDLDTNVTYTVVTRYAIATATSTLWIDPASEGAASVTATDTVIFPYINPTYYSFRQASSEGTMRIDGLRVATTFAEVAGANTAPTISAIPDQAIARNGTTGALPFTVGDAETDPALLTVTKDSINITLVPLSGITILPGDGTNRTVAVTPATGQQGTTLITLAVDDGVNTNKTSFVVTVGAPSISDIPNQIIVSNTSTPAISFTVTDPENDTVTVTGTSSWPSLLTDANIIIGGSGSSRTVTLTPQANQIGWARVTLYATDGFSTNSTSFILTVRPLLGVLLRDTFAYTSFNFFPNSLYDAVGSPWQTASGVGYQLQVTNGWAYIGNTNSEDVAASLTNSTGTFPDFTPYYSSNGVVFYSSFTLKATSLPSYSGSYFAHLKDGWSGTTFRAKVYGDTNGAAPGSYRIGIANSANVGTYYPLDCSLGANYFVVTRYNSATGESVLWVNPLAESLSSLAATDTATPSNVGAYGLREAGDSGDLQVSNLVVSTSFPTLPPLAPITITQITVSGGTVTINFDAGANDTVAGFDLQSAGTVNGTYAATGATITNPSSTKFQATIATAGSAQFYRIVRK